MLGYLGQRLRKTWNVLRSCHPSVFKHLWQRLKLAWTTRDKNKRAYGPPPVPLVGIQPSGGQSDVLKSNRTALIFNNLNRICACTLKLGQGTLGKKRQKKVDYIIVSYQYHGIRIHLSHKCITFGPWIRCHRSLGIIVLGSTKVQHSFEGYIINYDFRRRSRANHDVWSSGL